MGKISCGASQGGSPGVSSRCIGVCCCCLIVYLKPEAPFKWHLAVLAIGIAVPTAAFALEAGTFGELTAFFDKYLAK
jgi:hypothetical protein